ncbi:MAG: aldehyde dehydrogenase family protein [Hyphomicrobiales bacterium]|nr:MAG: aldehyde dehydrogenase family protein [Hyphomicrobiales bacterium]
MDAPHTLPLDARQTLDRIGIKREAYSDGTLFVRSAIDGSRLAKLRETDGKQADAAMARSVKAFASWRETGLGERLELVRLIGEHLRRHAADLAHIITLETGKPLADSLEEVTQAIARCDYASGLGHQIHGTAGVPEQRNQYTYDAWHPLGPTGCITSFNQTVLQYAVHAFITVMCGNTVIWKPSEKSSLSALAVFEVIQQAVRQFGKAPQGLFELLLGGRDIGKLLCEDSRISLVSASGSMNAGRTIGLKLAQRFSRSLLHLGGNNAALICPSADLGLALPQIVDAVCFSSGQCCRNLRRLFVYEEIYDEVVTRLKSALDRVPVGDPLDPATAMGPLIGRAAFESMQRALQEVRAEAAPVTGGERVLAERYPLAYYVKPAVVEMAEQDGPMLRETLAPIVYVMRVSSVREAIALNNDADAGLASSIFSRDLDETNEFFGPNGNDCGMANLNLCLCRGESGLPFGGNKASGGGRTAGTDFWKSHMRRAVVTLSFEAEPRVSPAIRKAVAAAELAAAAQGSSKSPPRTR